VISSIVWRSLFAFTEQTCFISARNDVLDKKQTRHEPREK
jgi:hypothetical protein